MGKENDPDELADLDIEPEQAINAILDDEDADEEPAVDSQNPKPEE
jgi:hypothetical protein